MNVGTLLSDRIVFTFITMKYLILLFSLFSLSEYGQNTSFDYAYVSKKGICVYSVADKREVLITAHGWNPAISPDGKKLAYTDGPVTGKKFITLVDLNTNVKTKLDTHGDGSGPIWSPDGKYIACNGSVGGKTVIKVIGVNTPFFSALTGKTSEQDSPRWLANSKGIMIQDMEKILIVDLADNVTTTYKMKDLEGGLPELKEMIGNANSDVFMPTADGKKIVFSCGDDGSADGPLNGVFIYDIATKKTTRLSPKKYDADEPVIKGNTVLFTAAKYGSRVNNIYSVDMNGGNFKLLFANCTSVSARN